MTMNNKIFKIIVPLLVGSGLFSLCICNNSANIAPILHISLACIVLGFDSRNETSGAR